MSRLVISYPDQCCPNYCIESLGLHDVDYPTALMVVETDEIKERDYEYVVWDNIDNEIHRGPWTKQECEEWLQETRDIFPVGAKIDKLWSIRRRERGGEWERYEEDCN